MTRRTASIARRARSLRALVGCAAVAPLALSACESGYPAVIVVSRADEELSLRELSFHGCVWDEVLGRGQATTVGYCLPGEDRVHFERLDLRAHCLDEQESGALGGGGACSRDRSESASGGGGDDDEEEDRAPTWFAYQTISSFRVDYGDEIVIEIRSDDMEQDFSVPGPYGH